MAYAVIHTASRVVRRVTTDPTHATRADETLVNTGPAISLDPTGSATGFWKLDGRNERVEASQSEVDDAGVDKTRVAAARATLRATRDSARDAVIALDPGTATAADVATAVKALAQAEKNLEA